MVRNLYIGDTSKNVSDVSILDVGTADISMAVMRKDHMLHATNFTPIKILCKEIYLGPALKIPPILSPLF